MFLIAHAKTSPKSVLETKKNLPDIRQAKKSFWSFYQYISIN